MYMPLVYDLPYTMDYISRPVHCRWPSRQATVSASTTVAEVSAPRVDLPYTSHKTPHRAATGIPGAPRSSLRDLSTLYYLERVT